MHLSLQSAGGSLPGALRLPKTLRVGLGGPIEALDPRAGAHGSTAMVLAQIFETPSALFEPLRAEDDAHTLFSAAVQPEVRFSDGTLLTAELAAVSLRGTRALAEKATVDARAGRVWFRLATPNPQFELLLARHATAIVFEKGTQFHGTGPFMFDHRPSLRMLELSPSIRLVRNPYYRGLTTIQEVRFTVIPLDADGVPRKLLYALRQESIDLVTSIDPAVMRAPGLASIVQPGDSTAVLFFNGSRRPTSNADVRRGIAAALDRRELAFACYDRNSDAFTVAGVPPRDLDEARRLLRGMGSRLTLLAPPALRPNLPRPAILASTIQSQLVQAGVGVIVLEARNHDEYHATLRNGTFDLALASVDAVDARMPFTPLVSGYSTALYTRHLRNVAINPDGILAIADVTLE
jgi:ABC-type transport system substrate-binding protein